MEWETVIGLEVHVELNTASKMFCGCSTAFGADPNTQVCPVCLGLPGVLPVPNGAAIEKAVRVGLALGGEIAHFSKFDRKNYFYPDLPKAYQISQYDLPLVQGGSLIVEGPDGPRRIGITRVHMEEDAGKLLHQNDAALVDLNRAGVPLIEIVSEPDLRSAEEARIYLARLRTIIEYLGVSDVRMEEGSLRADANVSVRQPGGPLGTRTEIKNVNSFKTLERAILYEVRRQIEILTEGGSITQETRGWDEARGRTFPLRDKEEANDYRYFPDPDLEPLHLDPAWIEALRGGLPELPEARFRRLVEEDGLPPADADLLVSSLPMMEFYENCRHLGGEPKPVANWLMGEFSRLINAGGPGPMDGPLTPEALVELLGLLSRGAVTGKAAKEIFEEMYRTGRRAPAITLERGLGQIQDEGEIQQAVADAVAENPQSVADFRSGKDKAITFLIGQVMRKTRGRANPARVEELLRAELAR